MATHTGTRRVLEFFGGVTIAACHVLVASEQRKSRFRVIEQRNLPVRLAVTTLAAGSLLSGVNVILAMAGYAVCFQFLPKGPVRMTVFALRLGMLAEKRIARILRMIKSRGLPSRLQVT